MNLKEKNKNLEEENKKLKEENNTLKIKIKDIDMKWRSYFESRVSTLQNIAGFR